MDSYINLFLSKKNLSYDVNLSDGLGEDKGDAKNILKMDSRIINNIKFNILLFQLEYPKNIEKVNIKSNDITDLHYDTSLILELYDEKNKKLYTFYDLLYFSNIERSKAEIEFNKIEKFINSSNNEEILLNELANALI